MVAGMILKNSAVIFKYENILYRLYIHMKKTKIAPIMTKETRSIQYPNRNNEVTPKAKLTEIRSSKRRTNNRFLGVIYRPDIS